MFQILNKLWLKRKKVWFECSVQKATINCELWSFDYETKVFLIKISIWYICIKFIMQMFNYYIFKFLILLIFIGYKNLSMFLYNLKNNQVILNLGPFVTRRNYPPIAQEGDTFHEFTTHENYPPPPSLTKNKVNHINKIFMTKLSLMHLCLFSNKNQFVLRIWFSLSITINLQRLA